MVELLTGVGSCASTAFTVVAVKCARSINTRSFRKVC